ncbi:MAG: c-type cytochrome [Pseudomonadota bacterium]
MKVMGSMVAILALAAFGSVPSAFADGKALYDQHCKKCHGDNLKGNEKITKMMKPEKPETMDLTGAAVKGLDDAAIKKSIEVGSRKMKAMKVSPAEADEITKYVKSQQK